MISKIETKDKPELAKFNKSIVFHPLHLNCIGFVTFELWSHKIWIAFVGLIHLLF